MGDVGGGHTELAPPFELPSSYASMRRLTSVKRDVLLSPPGWRCCGSS